VGLGVVPGADEQGVESSEAHELLELHTGFVRDHDRFEVDPRRAQEHINVAQKALGSSGAIQPRPRVVLDRYQERDAERLIPRVLATDCHQAVRIDVRLGRDKRAMKRGYA